MITARPPHVHRARRARRENRPPTNDPVHLTDRGNGIRVVQRDGQDLRHCFPWRKWIIWAGTHWQMDDTGEATRCVKRMLVDTFATAVAEVKAIEEELKGMAGEAS